MTAARAESRTVTHVFHPAATGELLALANGVHARVVVADEPGYQLDSGETFAV